MGVIDSQLLAVIKAKSVTANTFTSTHMVVFQCKLMSRLLSEQIF